MQSANAEVRFREVYHECRKPILAYFLRRTDHGLAFDDTAEAFLVAWCPIDDVPDGGTAPPGLHDVAGSVLSDLRRHQRRFDRLEVRVDRENWS